MGDTGSEACSGVCLAFIIALMSLELSCFKQCLKPTNQLGVGFPSLHDCSEEPATTPLGRELGIYLIDEGMFEFSKRRGTKERAQHLKVLPCEHEDLRLIL